MVDVSALEFQSTWEKPLRPYFYCLGGGTLLKQLLSFDTTNLLGLHRGAEKVSLSVSPS
jgi:hypothetical protein